jgi:hypothetical protein
MSDLKTSLLVNRQVPEFVRDEYPLFITFLEAYYEFLENKQGTKLNDLTQRAKDLRYISDVDESIADFENNFFNTYATLLPKDVQVDKAFLIKNVLPLYLAKGNEKSFKLLFRMLFNDEVDIILPKNAVLRLSDGKWTVDNILKVEDNIRTVSIANGTQTYFRTAQEVGQGEVDVYVNGVLKSFGNTNDYILFKDDRYVIFNSAPAANSVVEVYYSNFDPIFLNPTYSGGLLITGLTSGATAIIERAGRRIISDGTNLGAPFEIFINSKTLTGNFINGEVIQALAVDPDGIEAGILTLQLDTFSIVNRINVVNKGASYNVGDPVIVTGGGASSDATAVVSNTVSGVIDSITITNGGAGFSLGGNVLVNGVFTGNLEILLNGIDTTGVANSTSNTFYVNTDLISNYSSTLISSSDYGFPSTINASGENVNTVIADALTTLTMTDLGPITNVLISASNVSVSTIPLLDAYGATFLAGAQKYSIRKFGSVGRFKINSGGTGYQVGDEIVFGANPSGTFGRGAAAAVKAVDATNGAITQIEIQTSRVSGTANITNNTAQIIGTGTYFGTEIRVNDTITVNNQIRYINAISNSTHATVNVNWTSSATNKKVGRDGIYLLGGQGYTQGNFPAITVSSSNVSATGANVEILTTMSDGESLTPFVGSDPPGAILGIRMIDGGMNYTFIPQIDLTGYGDGTATAVAQVDGVYTSLPGRWTTSDSIISSSERKIQGRDYYVDYSYITSSETEFAKYKSVLKNLLHPAGMINYADLNKTTSLNANTISISTISGNTISGTVNVANASIFVIGTNTKFNVSNTLGILTVGSNIAIDGIIRTVNNIISNTNISVSSAFTSNANAQTVIILI